MFLVTNWNLQSKFLAGGIKVNLIALISAGVISGFFMPLFSHLPILKVLDCFPCNWMWISGILAVALYRWLLDAEESLTGYDGAIAGIFTGVVAAFTSLILAILLGINSSTGTVSASVVPIIDQVDRIFENTNLQPNSFMLLFLINLISYPIISGISGLIGVALFGKSRSRERVF